LLLSFLNFLVFSTGGETYSETEADRKEGGCGLHGAGKDNHFAKWRRMCRCSLWPGKS